jgi:glyoxylase-like metal-dependent hydrolase (beta-lactamase superfamily II)
MLLGDITVTPIIDGAIRGVPATGFPNRSPEDWEPYREHLSADGGLVSQIGGFLVRSGDRVVLVDAGGGPVGEKGTAHGDLREQLAGQFRAKGLTGDAVYAAVDLALGTTMTHGQLPASLEAEGLRPQDVTDVVFTHLHSDHIGWASDAGHPYFTNATYHCSRADLDYFHGPDVDEAFSMMVWGTLSAKDRLAPVLDRLVPFDEDGPLVPGVDVQRAPGHTPGSTVVVLSSGKHRALVLGDMVHCPVELQDGDWQCIGDVDPVLAARTKAAYLREMADGTVLGAGSHFPGLRFGRLLQGESRTGWTFVD